MLLKDSWEGLVHILIPPRSRSLKPCEAQLPFFSFSFKGWEEPSANHQHLAANGKLRPRPSPPTDVPALASGVLVWELWGEQRTREESRDWLSSLTVRVWTGESQVPPSREHTAFCKAPDRRAFCDRVAREHFKSISCETSHTIQVCVEVSMPAPSLVHAPHMDALEPRALLTPCACDPAGWDFEGLHSSTPGFSVWHLKC